MTHTQTHDAPYAAARRPSSRGYLLGLREALMISLNSAKETVSSPSASAKESIRSTVVSSALGSTVRMATWSSATQISPSPLVSIESKTARSSSSVKRRRPPGGRDGRGRGGAA